MAGLVAAAHARRLGLAPVVYEKGTRPGGSMLLSSCVVWRYQSAEEFRAQCPDGDPELQARIVERLDDDLDWLERLGAPVVARETANPLTVGCRFDARGLTDALVRAAGDVRLETSVPGDAEPLVLATGGFGGALARRLGLPLRANPWSEGDGLALARGRGAAFVGDEGEFYGRLMPDTHVPENEFVPAAQLYARHALMLDREGREISTPLSWSEVEAPQALARAGGRGWLVVRRDVLDRRVGARTVSEMIETAKRLGAAVHEHGGSIRVAVVAAVTHTHAGIKIDAEARALDGDGRPVNGLYAAGADAGGISLGGYASGLASALVFGRLAAETAARQ